VDPATGGWGGAYPGGGAIAAAPTHYFVDVPNPEESTYEKAD
jgi:C4-type Zn-finger protein